MNQEIQDYIIRLFGQIEDAVVDVAPEVLDIALMLTRIGGVQNLVIALAAGILAAAMLPVFTRNKKAMENLPKHSSEHEVRVVTGIISVIIGIIGFTTFAVMFFNVWNWVKIIQPEIGLARDIFLKLTQ